MNSSSVNELREMLNRVIAIEGKYVNDPKDSGGETNWGITVAVARAYGYTGAMKKMPRQVAETIYLERYWFMPKFNQIANVSPALAEKMFDCGINMGQTVPVQYLQRSLNVLNLNENFYPDVATDGLIGPMTLAALRAFVVKRKEEGLHVLTRMVNGLQSTRYIELAEARPKDERYVYGWILNRINCDEKT